MELNGKRFVVIGGAGLIGSHTIDQLLKSDVKEVVIYDNFVRGTAENLSNAWEDGAPAVFKIERPDVSGSLLSTPIGPAKSWQSIESSYTFSNNPTADTVTFDVLGYNINLGNKLSYMRFIRI